MTRKTDAAALTGTETRGHVGLERRASGDTVTVAGYAAVFGETVDIGDFYREVISPGAFTETLKSADVRAFLAHDSGRVLGRKSAGTLRLTEDFKGLAVEIDLPDTSDGRDTRVLIERGDLTGMSFGFMVTKQEWDETGDIPTRTIKEVVLREVSIVAIPAYDGTSVALRSLEALRNERRAQNFNAAAKRLGKKVTFDLHLRTKSKA